VNLEEPKEGGNWERVGVVWGEIHRVGKHIKVVSNLGESWETKI